MKNSSLINVVRNIRRAKYSEKSNVGRDDGKEKYLEKENNYLTEESKAEDNSEGIDVPSPGEYEEEYVEEPDEDESLRDVDVKYPLVPEDPDEGEMVYAWAHINWDEDEGELVYKIIEPERSPKLDKKIKKITDILERSFDVDFNQLEGNQAEEYLIERIEMIVNKYDISLSDMEREIVTYYTKRDFAGLGKIQPLMNDTEVEDISCDGTDIPIYAYHRNPRYGSLKTNIEWSNSDQLDKFVMKLAQRCGRSISVSSPLLDGSLPDGSRVQATLATDIARKGSNFTIRRFTEDPLTPVHMMDFGTENAQMLSYLWTLVENGKSTLVCGTTGAGKTSQLNALSLFIRPDKKIVSIEDTPELRLPHEHWVPEVARSGFGSSAKENGEVSMDNLLKESLRQRPDYIIVGEVRGQEAYILFQQMATGHTGLSTIHADNLEMLMDRLTTNPIDLSGSLIETLDCIMMIKRIRKDGKYVRRVTDIYEVLGYDERKGIETNDVFTWNPKEDTYQINESSIILGDIANQRGISESKIKKELMTKQQVLDYMHDEQIKNYKKVGDLISKYYSDPKSLLSDIEKNFQRNEGLEVNNA